MDRLDNNFGAFSPSRWEKLWLVCIAFPAFAYILACFGEQLKLKDYVEFEFGLEEK